MLPSFPTPNSCVQVINRSLPPDPAPAQFIESSIYLISVAVFLPLKSSIELLPSDPAPMQFIDQAHLCRFLSSSSKSTCQAIAGEDAIATVRMTISQLFIVIAKSILDLVLLNLLT
ncbi:unnamed protein product [Cuscuta epithymum]|uniref:Uncharacterized protein n=1 Tax=Cuscuta epithymum TaxID=186058 RepID=A0AAV0EHQ9_9ASTE|nr:unnamed protein product [Cuscuta epithymum]